MEKMVSKSGVKTNMCCASCKYNNIALVGHDYKRICLKKNTIIKDVSSKCNYYVSSKCNYYVMQDFFRKRGYKPL